MRHMTVGSSYVDERKARLMAGALARTIPLPEPRLHFDFQERRFRQVPEAENKGTVARHSVRPAKAFALLRRVDPRTAPVPFIYGDDELADDAAPCFTFASVC